MAIDVINSLQDHYGYFSDEALVQAADLLTMSPLEVEELATFYTFIYREPVGKYVIHVCDSLICWMESSEDLAAHLQKRLGIKMGETTATGCSPCCRCAVSAIAIGPRLSLSTAWCTVP
jgi:NADH-quinone oxidoreductase subunit E